MKKIYILVILLSLGITQIYAQCYTCGTGTNSFWIGAVNTAGGANSFAGGNLSTASGSNSFAFGYQSTVAGLRGIALGNETSVSHTDGIAIGSTVISAAANSYLFGQNLSSGVANSITIGLGTASNSLLSNTKAGSIMFGVTHNPSLTIAKPKSIATIGFLGIGTTEPKEMVQINNGNLLLTSTGAANSSLLFGEVDEERSWCIERIVSNNMPSGLDFSVTRSIRPQIGPPIIEKFKVLFLDNNQRVGIGTQTPTTKLDVAGGFKATNAEITKTLTAQSATIEDVLTADRIRVENLLCAREVKVQIRSCWPDFVFGKNYKLMPLQELEQFVNENQHLPEIPSAATVEENGIHVGEMNALLLKKIEELTLYVLDLQKQIDELKK